MRNFLVLIILGAGCYFGWKAWQEQPEWLVRILPKSVAPAAEDASTTASDDSSTPPASSTPAAPAAPAPPQFVSRIQTAGPATTGDSGKVAPGTFLVIARASVETKDGVIAIVPGDKVRLLDRRKDGTLKVTNGQADFVLNESQVTQDVAVAQNAERQDFEKRYGRLR
jgi:cytoskeletal protein RodZ